MTTQHLPRVLTKRDLKTCLEPHKYAAGPGRPSVLESPSYGDLPFVISCECWNNAFRLVPIPVDATATNLAQAAYPQLSPWSFPGSVRLHYAEPDRVPSSQQGGE